ncbi:MAG: hypothetical protein O2894_14025 [Planctomycetota bacterium]|nr:hypothetical protein [Planctomycetota bacterium]
MREMTVEGAVGRDHFDFKAIGRDLKAGQWPAATLGSRIVNFEIKLDGTPHQVTCMDYSGEVFTKTYRDDSMDDDCRELREAIDSAMALIILLDPGVMRAQEAEADEDQYCIQMAVKQVRAIGPGPRVPVAIVLTKCDQHKDFLMREVGGAKRSQIRKLCGKWIPQVFRLGEPIETFASAAVPSKKVLGVETLLPRADKPGINLVEPVFYCLHTVEEERGRAGRLAAEKAERKRIEAVRQDQAVRRKRQERSEQMSSFFFWVSAIVVFGAVVGVGAYLILNS